MTGKIVGIFSPAGGVGVTTIACHLAVAFARKGTEVALVDLVRDFGTVPEVVKFKPKWSLDQIDIRHFEKTSTSLAHPTCKGLHVYCNGSSAPGHSSLIKVAELLDLLKDRYPFTIVDLPHTFLTSDSVAVGEAADTLVVVAEYQWATIERTRRFLNTADSSNPRLRKTAVIVLNKSCWLPQDVVRECRAKLDAPVAREFVFTPGLQEKSILPDSNLFSSSVRDFSAQLERALS